MHAGYRPLGKPQGVIDGSLSGELGLCLASILDDSAPNLTLLSGTIIARTFYTWDGSQPATASITS